MLRLLLEMAVLQLILFAVYYLFLKKETDYVWRRAYLLTIVIISVVAPLIELPAPDVVHQVSSSYQLPAMNLSSDQIGVKSATSMDWTQVMIVINLLGSTVLLALVLWSLYQIYGYYKDGTPHNIGRLLIWMHPKVHDSFSFFNWIFSKKLDSSIIAHEAAHVSLKHSYDVVLLQLNRMVFWWNPISWMLLREMTQIHEYQADRRVIKDNNIDEYQNLLINSTLSSMGWGLASSFHSGSLLKRLQAMKIQSKKINRWKIRSLGVLVAMIGLFFACEELDQNIKKLSEGARQIGFDELPANMQKVYFEGESKFTFMKVYIEADEVDHIKEKLESIKTIDPELIESYSLKYGTNEPQEVIVVLRRDADSYDYVKESTKLEADVYTMVEKMPEFPGGMDAFYQYIGQNMTYPRQARRIGIEGQVFVQFVVDKEGNVTKVETVKGIGAGCDSVAAAVVAKAPKFVPGTQDGQPVDVQMVLPITFSLGSKESKNVEKVASQRTLIELKEVEAQRIGEIEAERTEREAQKLKEAASVLSEMVVVGNEVVDETRTSMPEYKGGMVALYKFIGNNMKYPTQAKNAGVQGRVFVRFVVKTDGTVDQVKVAKGIGAGCDKEAVRVIKMMNNWSPGMKDGRAVDVEMTLPVKFSL